MTTPQYFVNLTQATSSDPFGEGRVKFQDSTDGTLEEIKMCFDEETSTLTALPLDAEVPVSSVETPLPEGIESPMVVWALTRSLGLVDRHSPSISIMAFQDAFLVALHGGAIFLESTDDGGNPDSILLDAGYPGDNLDRVTFLTPDTFASAPWRTPETLDSIHHIIYKWRNWGPSDVLSHYEASTTRVFDPTSINSSYHENLEKIRLDQLEAERIRKIDEKARRRRQANISNLLNRVLKAS